jgi:hypothetical protein
VPSSFELGNDDLVHVEEAVLLEADVDERRFHSRKDVVDRPLVDVPGDGATAGALEVDLGDDPVLENGDALLAHVNRDENLLADGRQRSLLRRRAATAGSRLLVLFLLPGRFGRGGRGLSLGLLLSPASSAGSSAAPRLTLRLF